MIFLSYSRKDARIVVQMEKIVRATGGKVWRDEHSIEPGDPWRQSITDSIDACDRMLVFWCRHSEASPEVENEYTQAIEKYKPVVPVVMDKKPLCPKLSPYNAIDVSQLAWWSHEIARRERYPWIAGLLFLLIGGLYAFFS